MIMVASRAAIEVASPSGTRNKAGEGGATAYVWIRDFLFFFSSRRRHTIFDCDWSSDVCSSDLQHDAEHEHVDFRRNGYRKELLRDAEQDSAEHRADPVRGAPDQRHRKHRDGVTDRKRVV